MLSTGGLLPAHPWESSPPARQVPFPSTAPTCQPWAPAGPEDHNLVAGPCQAVSPGSCSALITSPIPTRLPRSPRCVFHGSQAGRRSGGHPAPLAWCLWCPIEDGAATQSKSGNCPLQVKESRWGEAGGGSGSRAWGIPISPPAPLLGSLSGQPSGYGTPTPQSHPEPLQPWLPPEHPQEAVPQRCLNEDASAHP